MKRILYILALVALSALYTLPGKADAIYTYTGNPTPTGQLLGDFILPTVAISPLGPTVEYDVSPLSYEFTDGTTLFTPADSQAQFDISTTAAGAIVRWGVYLHDGPSFLSSQFYGSQVESVDAATYMALVGDPGTWTMTDPPPAGSSSGPVSTPEPATWLLLAVACAGLLWLMVGMGDRRQRRQV